MTLDICLSMADPLKREINHVIDRPLEQDDITEVAVQRSFDVLGFELG